MVACSREQDGHHSGTELLNMHQKGSGNQIFRWTNNSYASVQNCNHEAHHGIFTLLRIYTSVGKSISFSSRVDEAGESKLVSIKDTEGGPGQFPS